MYLLSLEGFYRLFDREVHREPAVHARSVLSRVSAVGNLLIKLCSEVSSEAMKLALVLLNCEAHSVKFLHAG